MTWSNDYFEPEQLLSNGYYDSTPNEFGVTETLSGQEMMAAVAGWEYVRKDYWHVQGREVIREHVTPQTLRQRRGHQ